MVNDLPDGWTGDAKRIVKLFTFASFAEALAFMNEVGRYCEQVNHHPEWKNIYNKIWVELTTHDAGGVTDKDRALAQHMDSVAKRSAEATVGGKAR